MKYVGTCLLAAFLLTGCGHQEETVYHGPDGATITKTKDGSSATYSDNKGNQVTSTDDGKNVAITDSKGNKFNMGGSVTETDLGLPFYPGSNEKPNGSMVAEENGQKSVMSARTTKDEPAKVGEFYKAKLQTPNDSNMNTGDTKIAMVTGKLSDGSEVTISASKKGSDDTEIMVGVKHKK